jgi:hypothetical protein
MTLTGNMLIGQQAMTGSREAIRAINPATDLPLEPAYAGGSAEHVEQACALAWTALRPLSRNHAGGPCRIPRNHRRLKSKPSAMN